jgi:hypothetical protein
MRHPMLSITDANTRPNRQLLCIPCLIGQFNLWWDLWWDLVGFSGTCGGTWWDLWWDFVVGLGGGTWRAISYFAFRV